MNVFASCELDDLRGLARSPDEGRRGDWEIRAIETSEHREGAASQLENALRCGEVAEAMLAEVVELEIEESAAVAAETSTCPPLPAAAIRAARWMSNPRMPLAREERRSRVQPDAHLSRP